ncbi:MAG: hypothetical protein L6Q99_13910 [Planctomycetes bacterium]|nr:hypothetical protein [Planctomycetota bacterium]
MSAERERMPDDDERVDALREQALEPEERDVMKQLEQAAELERDVLRAAAGPATEAEVRASRAAFDRLWQPPTQSTPRTQPAPRRVVPRLVLVAAALVVAGLAGWWFFVRATPAPQPGIVLGSGLEILEPRDGFEALPRVRWQTTTAGNPWFVVRIVDSASGAELLAPRELRGSVLDLETVDTSAWHRIRIEVDELDANRNPERSASVERSRRSP